MAFTTAPISVLMVRFMSSKPGFKKKKKKNQWIFFFLYRDKEGTFNPITAQNEKREIILQREMKQQHPELLYFIIKEKSFRQNKDGKYLPLSDSGMEEVREEEVVEVILLMEGALGPALPMYCSRMAVVCATHAEGSMGRTGSCRGTVKYPLGFGSQHLATTRTMGLVEKNIVEQPYNTSKRNQRQ